MTTPSHPVAATPQHTPGFAQRMAHHISDSNWTVKGDSALELATQADEQIARIEADLAQITKERDFAQSKLSKLGRLIEFADTANEGASDMEVAVSASFQEAMALESLSQTEAERDTALADLAACRKALEMLLKSCDQIMWAHITSATPDDPCKCKSCAKEAARACLAPREGKA